MGDPCLAAAVASPDQSRRVMRADLAPSGPVPEGVVVVVLRDRSGFPPNTSRVYATVMSALRLMHDAAHGAPAAVVSAGDGWGSATGS